MSNRQLTLLGIIAVIMAGAAVLQSRLAQRSSASEGFQSAPLIQGLEMDAIAGVTITSAKGTNTVTFKKGAGGFVVADKDNYPADISKLNRMLNSCLDIRTTERVTSDPANHADLGVTDTTAQYGVRLLDADGKAIAGVLISDSQPDRRDGVYARLTDSDVVYFVQSPLWLSTGAMEYINSTLISADRAKIRKVTIKGPQEEYQLESDTSGGIRLEKMPAGKQFKETGYKAVFEAAASIPFEDVMATEKASKEMVFDRSFVCELDDTTVYNIVIAQKDDGTYATVWADFLDKAPVEKERRVESEEELKKKEAKLLAIDAVESFNKRHKGWVYVIPSYKASELTKPLAELLEDKPAPDPEPEAEPTADPNAV